ncbi:L-2,4-diaminobutyric acid acetyltransferase [Paeniglutamicibacter gangotriensis Lz1y]|uniref:L-2,4-diaminobutyric acid acetyltransferase n=3 Tax=Paeniglutamicibacter gangotriensis TaxID=254787 RepID=M7MZ45_9MICC|nr:diaminobutyrate acetyltransferase [Paeniglutamicibacter gangotriensis]EMR00312.1 L-2,4-diaminobutyric acid acetyltransferase [Paeniglutamicibacter gangotriensis Lz1y]
MTTLEWMVEELENTMSEATFRQPAVTDGKTLWQMATDSQVLDVNTSYAYLLWCRDFAQTSIIAEIDGVTAGFITGYLRPDAPGTLMVWQVAVGADFQQRGLAASMLDELATRCGVEEVETTVTDDNAPSNRLFTRFAERHEAQMTRTALFTPEMYPDAHDTEFLYRIGPLNRGSNISMPELATAGSR